MSELSIFVDESGDFGYGSDYYVLSLVFHDQKRSIASELGILAQQLIDIGYDPQQVVHTGAVIRGEEEYRFQTINQRKNAFNRLFNFCREVPVKYHSFCFRKRGDLRNLKLKGDLSRALQQFLNDYLGYFLAYDKIIVYYDNGQAEITDILNTILNIIFSNVEFRKVKPMQYRLFQMADLCCTLTLLRAKINDSKLSRSDLYFFKTKRALERKYLDVLETKRLI